MRTRLATVLALTLLPGLAAASVPATLAFSARIADAGTPVTGSHAFVFTFWDVETGGAAGANDVWAEGQSLAVNDGVVVAVLGADTANLLPLAAFDGSALFLEVSMDGTVFGPRVALHSVPYAFRAGVAEEVDWTKVTNLPAGLADGVDNVGTLSCTNQTNSISVPNSSSLAIDATCPAGYTLTGGGHGNLFGASLVGNYPYSDTAWRVQVTNNSGASATVTAYARCCKVD
jgi:hypothetical protein